MSDGARVLIVGGGGRSHALGEAIANSPGVAKVVYAPGTSGLEYLGFETAPVASQDFHGLVELAEMEEYDLTVVGPNTPLVDGLADRFLEAGLPIFGPTQRASKLEGSKVYARLLMGQLGIPTPRFAIANNDDRARFMAKSYPWARVFKADGIAYDKGVRVCQSLAECDGAIDEVMFDNVYGLESEKLVVEERLDGYEITVFGMCDGTRVHVLGNVLNHPRLHDGDTGTPTRGMGQVSPAPLLDEAMVESIRQDVLQTTLDEMNDRAAPLHGALFVDLMLVKGEPFVIDYNVRFGDPATQTMLTTLSGDFYGMLQAARTGEGMDEAVAAMTIDPRPRVSLVLVCPGYPKKMIRGAPITLDKAPFDEDPDLWLFFDGVRWRGDDRLETTGGRTFTIVAAAESVEAARDKAYSATKHIQFEGMHFRSDIGRL